MRFVLIAKQTAWMKLTDGQVHTEFKEDFDIERNKFLTAEMLMINCFDCFDCNNVLIILTGTHCLRETFVQEQASDRGEFKRG